jgi:tRNA A-37 threonylcarbamoyl transferase component Bud32
LVRSEFASFVVIGKHINNYEVVSLLGEGGMGTVYLAVHPIMGRKAAIKVLKPELARDESLVGRFFNEARAANAIRHPNIIDIIDVGLTPDDNVPYMLMEFLEGESLAGRLDRVRPLPIDQAVEITLQTASALAAAHSKGIVHRDLKPDNLFLVPDEMVGNGERVKVLDFGIAKLRDDMRGSSMKTRTGAIMGTAAYMSPEQCQGLIERIDHRTDVYALGVILFEMLCGGPPFVSEGFGDIIIMHVMKAPENPQLRNPAIPDNVAAAILRALAKSPDDRFQSMLEFQAALRTHGLSRATPVHGISTGYDVDLGGLGWPALAATPAPVTLRPGSVPPRAGSTPPSYVPTLVEPTAPTKQTTTFRTHTGEVTEAPSFPPPNKRRTVVAVSAIVGVAAVALAITVLVTRPSAHAPAADSTPVPATAPAPDPDPDPIPARKTEPEFVPPRPDPAAAPSFAPTPSHTDEHTDDNDRRSNKKGLSNKPPRKGGGRPIEGKPVEKDEPEPASPAGGKNTERW